MRSGLIIDFNHKGHKKWVVVNVNDCRAYIVPLANRDPEDPSEVFDESESHCTGISPNSGCEVYGRVKGQIKTRVSIVYKKAVPEPLPARTSFPVRTSLPVKRIPKFKAPLPSIPEDPDFDSIQLVITATSRDFS
jgi:hypothetical protein